jgi:hypothetical protein
MKTRLDALCKAIFALMLAALSAHILSAQTAATPSEVAKPSFLRYGIFGGATVNNHIADFTEFATYVAEPSPLRQAFGTTNGLVSYYAGAFVEIPLVDRFGVALRASLANVGGFTMIGKEHLLYPLQTNGGVGILQISHTLTIDNLQMLSGEPYLTYRVLDGLTLYAGARFGYLLNPTFSYKQKIPDDSPLRFSTPNGQSEIERDVRNGTISQANTLNTALSLGASIEIPIDAEKHWFFAVEGFYMHGLTQVANGLLLRRPLASFNGLPATRTVPVNELGSDRDPTSAAWPSEIVPGSWLLHNIRGGLSLRYAP